MPNHVPVIKLLTDNGATLSSGDMGQFACFAAEQNNFELLKEIVRHGGDVTLPKNTGSTALHFAVCEGNIEMVKFLLDQGADVDKTDDHGWTPIDLADQQGHEDIKLLFQSHPKHTQTQSAVPVPEEKHGVRFLGRFKSEPAIRPVSQAQEGDGGGSLGRSRTRRRGSNFHNSLFGIMSSANTGDNDLLLSVNQNISAANGRNYAARVTVSCPQKGDVTGKLVLLPQSFQQLLEIGTKKYGFLPTKVLIKDGAEIEEIELIRDGDHLVFVSDSTVEEHNPENIGQLR